MSKLYFIYNKISSLDLGISIKSMPRDVLAEKRIEKLSFPKIDGFVYQDDNIFESYNIDLECTVCKGFNLNHIRKIKDVFKLRTGELILSVKEDYILSARLLSVINFEKLISQTSGRFLLSFEIQPFAHLKSGKEWLMLSNNFKLINQGNYKSKPLFKVTGSGSCTISINNKEMKFSNVNREFILDTELEDIYSGDKKENLNKFLNIESDFIELEEGENIIKFTGISKLEVQPNWREL
ncbi:MAG: phage distal tail protein [Sarcina sp.]